MTLSHGKAEFNHSSTQLQKISVITESETLSTCFIHLTSPKRNTVLFTCE